MLNFGAKKEAIARLENAAGKYEKVADETKKGAVTLHGLREQAAKGLIVDVENLVNRLKNTPTEFDKTVSEFRVEVNKFRAVVEEMDLEARRVERVGGTAAGGGVMAGVGVAALGPSAAMAVATTFGTASTGTAISALSGAAATNAALAWLGGGALAAGGGGMAGGSAFLALAGPVGLGIAAAALGGAAVYTHVKNGKVAEQATKEAERVEADVRSLNAARIEIERLTGLTTEHTAGIKTDLKHLGTAPDDYKRFSDEQKKQLSSLLNNVKSLGKLLNKQVR